MISYTGANADFLPAKMNFDTGNFEYGSWKDSWLFSKFKPCMLHADGSVAYYLNPHNLTQKITGGDAMGDLISTNHDMNAMMEVGQIWIKEEEIDEDRFHIYLSPTKQDGFDCWTHYNVNNKLVDYYYMAMFKGSLDSNNKIRSLARQKTNTATLNGKQMREYCQANGSGWDCREWNFHRLMKYILLLIGKTTNTQEAFGYGYTHGSSPILTGGNEALGLFYGANNTANHVTVFGMEDFWGNLWDLTNGIIANGTENIYVKMTQGTADSSTGSDYSEDISDYIAVPRPMGSENFVSDYIKKMKLIKGKGLFPFAGGGSSTTGYCDSAIFYSTDINNWTRVGGSFGSDENAGMFYLAVNVRYEYVGSNEGVSLTFKNPT